MTHEIHTPSVRPPVALGCVTMVALVALLVGAAVFAVTYLESGSSSGKVTLESAAAYPPDSFAFIAEHHFYLVRLGPARFYALADLDAANAKAAGRRCRVVVANPSDPALRAIAERYETRASPGAAGTGLFFFEECNGAVYDAVGVRLDADGRNLDRFPVDIDEAGRVVVELGKRNCTARDGVALLTKADC